jgi:hypothetical protein
MALFVVRHHHEAEAFPATDPFMGATLLNYLSRPNVRRLGVEIRGEAVVQGEHTLYMIVEGPDEGVVREFLQPFAMAGSVDPNILRTCPSSTRLSCAPRNGSRAGWDASFIPRT